MDRLSDALPGHDNEAFRKEAVALGLVFRCEDCVHYAPRTYRCSLEFDSRWLQTPEIRYLNDEGRVVFCKYFELD